MKTNRTVLYLDRETIASIDLPMKRIVEVVEVALIEKAHGRVQMPAKHWMEPRPTRWFGGMSSLVPKLGYAAMKWQSGSTENAAHGLPYITGMLFLSSIEHGVVAAVMDSTWITQQRTAAASAIAVKYLARKDATTYAMLGCGLQARSHLEAFRHVMPGLSQVVAYDVDPEAAAAFAREVQLAGFRSTVVDSPRAAVESADIVVTGGPIQPNLPRTIEANWLRPGLLGVTIDYDCYWKPEALAAADCLLTDDFGQIEHIKEYGYFVGCPRPHAELGSVVAGLRPGRETPQQKIIVMNMGVAVEDVATAKEIYEIARARKVGVELPL
jgi:ornithine cyclodeaminase/alanine dehydrogenase-like protein (mu-crystallin family)